ncbi:MAG: hypothetical protein ACJ79H_09260 [Myxococcales bacterium]
MLHRVIAAVALIALASTPVVARTRLFCRYTGVEITDCQQRDVAGCSEIQFEGCCDRQTTQPPGAIRIDPHQDGSPPVHIAISAAPVFAARGHRLPIDFLYTALPVFLVTRALLI